MNSCLQLRPHLLLLCATLLLVAVPAAQAQVLYGSLVGTVEDSSGAVVPNAKVTITEVATSLSRDGQTDDRGRYSFPSIPSGTYTVRTTASGFKTVVRENVEVTVNSVARVDLKLELGTIAETINVQESAISLQTEKADTRTEIAQKIVLALPLSQYRNYQALLNLTPGASPAATQNSATDTPQRALRTFVNGTATNNNVTRLDGATNLNVWLPHHVAYVAPSETVEAVNVVTSSFDAEQGMAGGAAMTVVSISGTNEFRGAAWEYHENQKLKSEPFFRPSNYVKPRYTLNIFGAKVGGPIIKNKLFFFGHYEGMRQGLGATSLLSVPNAALKTGDFSAYSTLIYDPLTGNTDGTARTPFSGNRIPVNRISRRNSQNHRDGSESEFSDREQRERSLRERNGQTGPG